MAGKSGKVKESLSVEKKVVEMEVQLVVKKEFLLAAKKAVM